LDHARGHLKKKQVADGLVLDAIHHVLEHLERFFLVLDQRIFLPIAAQTDAFLEVVHRQQVIFPLVVDDVEHDDALGVAHVLGTDQVLFFLVTRDEQIVDVRFDLLPRHALQRVGVYLDAEGG